jgi:hypothetical protein
VKKIRFIIQIFWAAPITILGLIYVTIFSMLKIYKYSGVYENALVWYLNEKKIPTFISSFWKKRFGQTFGNIVILQKNPRLSSTKSMLLYQLEHVRQYSILGFLYPAAYLVITFIMKITLIKSHHYFSHPFEIEARRASNQIIDVEGLKNKIKRAKNV